MLRKWTRWLPMPKQLPLDKDSWMKRNGNGKTLSYKKRKKTKSCSFRDLKKSKSNKKSSKEKRSKRSKANKSSLTKSSPDKLTDLEQESNSKEKHKSWCIKWKNSKKKKRRKWRRKKWNNLKLMTKLFIVTKMPCSLLNRESKKKSKKKKKLQLIWEKRPKKRLKLLNNKGIFFS